jgi:hypothetical protein
MSNIRLCYLAMIMRSEVAAELTFVECTDKHTLTVVIGCNQGEASS